MDSEPVSVVVESSDLLYTEEDSDDIPLTDVPDLFTTAAAVASSSAPRQTDGTLLLEVTAEQAPFSEQEVRAQRMVERETRRYLIRLQSYLHRVHLTCLLANLTQWNGLVRAFPSIAILAQASAEREI